ncbi:Transforming protein cbl, partial [Ophiophagus hannah]
MAMAPGPAWMPRRTGAHRSLEKTLQGLTKLQQLACQPQVALRNSAPHLPSLLPLIYQHLKLIREHYGAGLAEVWESDFFRIFLLNLLEKIKQATQLFKRGKDKEEILLEGSAASHMLAELQAVFPNGEDQGSTYQLSKQEAQVFWRGTWRERFFLAKSCWLCNVNLMAFSTICFASPSNSFPVFSSQPWPTLLKNWTYLAVTHPGYMAFLTYDEVKARLQAYVNKPGSYIFRLSCTRLGQWAIGYVTADRNILQTIPQKKSLFQALVDGHKEGLNSLSSTARWNPPSSFAKSAPRTTRMFKSVRAGIFSAGNALSHGSFQNLPPAPFVARRSGAMKMWRSAHTAPRRAAPPPRTRATRGTWRMWTWCCNS